MDNQEDALYNPILSGHSPHSNHAAIMIVNPTTPNSNIPNQNMVIKFVYQDIILIILQYII